jgi:class 3 adenylate cyclase/pimeloyl-ACP methyl ester carboxylesterase
MGRANGKLCVPAWQPEGGPAMERRLMAILSADVVGFSRMMGVDEVGTLAQLKALRARLVEPLVAEHHGRIIKLMGDGALMEFPSAVQAVECGLAIQRGIASFDGGGTAGPDIALRIAIHVGDVIIEGRDVYGDGVNIAARLEKIAPPGRVCVSEDVRRMVEGKVEARFDDFGVHRLKNIAQPVRAFVIGTGAAGRQSIRDQRVEVKYCRSKDGVRIAHAALGEGPPLVKAASFMTHLGHDRESPVMRPRDAALSMGYRYIRYDQRGCGLSDWEVADFSLEAMVSDLEAVAEALGLQRFPILGISQGSAIAIAYAVRHPERVSCLVLYGGYAAGWRRLNDPHWREQREAMLALVRVGWGADNPAFRQVYTSLFVPGGSAEQHQWFNDLQRVATTPDNAHRIMTMFAEIDVRDRLGRVTQPTLVLHCRNDAVVPIRAGREIAAGIPNASFVELDGANHVILEQDACWPRFLAEVRAFLAEHAI